MERSGDEPLNNLADCIAGARNERDGRSGIDRYSRDVIGTGPRTLFGVWRQAVFFFLVHWSHVTWICR
jgi:hypothetical protein